MLYIISCYFNPLGYKSRFENFKLFYEGIKKTGYPHLIVELGSESILRTIVDKKSLYFIQYDNTSTIWQKERLLNIALSRLPSSCLKVCWVDCDVLFQTADWPDLVADLLDRYIFIQPFSFVVNLPKGITNVAKLNTDSFPLRHNNCSRMYSYFLGILDKGILKGDGHPGFLWAARRSLLTKHNFYDRNIVGGGDYMMSRAASFHHYSAVMIARYSKYHLADYYQWAQPFCDDISSNINALNIPIFHLYHGQINNRQYGSRLSILKDRKYNPKTDICLDKEVWQLTRVGHVKFDGSLQAYFKQRKEDG